MSRRHYKASLRPVIRRVARRKTPTRSAEIRLKEDGNATYVDFDIHVNR